MTTIDAVRFALAPRPRLSPGEAHALSARRNDDAEIRRRTALYSAAERTCLYVAETARAAPSGASTGRRRRADVLTDPLLFPSMAQPPCGNTGADAPETPSLFKEPGIKIDWLNVTFPAERLADVREHVEQLFGPAEDRLFGIHTYQKSAGTEPGALLAWTDGRGEALLSIRGDAVDWLTPAQQLELVKWLASIGARATRLDCAFDDYMRIVPLDVLRKNAHAGNFSGFGIIDGHKPLNPFTGEVKGDSVEFGVRGKDGSGKFLRVYDKALESNGAVDCIRWEIELSKAKADAVFKTLAQCASLDDFTRTIAETIGGCIDFRARAGYERHFGRAPRLCWWQRILELLRGELRVKLTDVGTTLAKAADALKQQWGCTIALVRHVLDSQGVNLHAVIDEWCERYAPRINWRKQGRRDLSLSVPMLLAVT